MSSSTGLAGMGHGCGPGIMGGEGMPALPHSESVGHGGASLLAGLRMQQSAADVLARRIRLPPWAWLLIQVAPLVWLVPWGSCAALETPNSMGEPRGTPPYHHCTRATRPAVDPPIPSKGSTSAYELPTGLRLKPVTTPALFTTITIYIYMHLPSTSIRGDGASQCLQPYRAPYRHAPGRHPI